MTVAPGGEAPLHLTKMIGGHLVPGPLAILAAPAEAEAPEPGPHLGRGRGISPAETPPEGLGQLAGTHGDGREGGELFGQLGEKRLALGGYLDAVLDMLAREGEQVGRHIEPVLVRQGGDGEQGLPQLAGTGLQPIGQWYRLAGRLHLLPARQQAPVAAGPERPKSGAAGSTSALTRLGSVPRCMTTGMQRSSVVGFGARMAASASGA